MPRKARIIKPDFPHHIVQRGNRKMNVFFKDNDYRFYLDLLKEWCAQCNIDIWAYCLMSNLIHLILVPHDLEGMAKAMGEIHKRYSVMINKREGWTGHLWQGRYASFDMDDAYALSAVRYVEMNPVAAGLVERPEHYRWSSAAAHMGYRSDDFLIDDPLGARIHNWEEYLMMPEQNTILQTLRQRG